MAEYSELDYYYASELREAVHREALAKIRVEFPDAEDVADCHPVEDYLTQYWDYPGAWYTMVAIPEGFRSRDAFVDALVKDTLARLRRQKESSFPIRRAYGEEMLALWGSPELESAGPTARFFYRHIASGNALFWALTHEGAIIGELYVFLQLTDRDFADGKNTAYLCAFRVKQRWRGQGLGSRLMNTALQDLKQRGFRGATVGVGKDETRNRLFYHQLGFHRKIKDCTIDPCRMDEHMQPAADPGFWLLYRSL